MNGPGKDRRLSFIQSVYCSFWFGAFSLFYCLSFLNVVDWLLGFGDVSRPLTVMVDMAGRFPDVRQDHVVFSEASPEVKTTTRSGLWTEIRGHMWTVSISERNDDERWNKSTWFLILLLYHIFTCAFRFTTGLVLDITKQCIESYLSNLASPTPSCPSPPTKTNADGKLRDTGTPGLTLSEDWNRHTDLWWGLWGRRCQRRMTPDFFRGQITVAMMSWYHVLLRSIPRPCTGACSQHASLHL